MDAVDTFVVSRYHTTGMLESWEGSGRLRSGTAAHLKVHSAMTNSTEKMGSSSPDSTWTVACVAESAPGHRQLGE